MSDFSKLCTVHTQKELSLIEDALGLYRDRHRWDMDPSMKCVVLDLQYRVKLAREWMEQLDSLSKQK